MRTNLSWVEIIKLGCTFFGIDRDILISDCRVHSIAHPRQIIMTAIYNVARTRPSTPQIGEMFIRHHSTVLSAFEAVSMRKSQFEQYSKFITYLKKVSEEKGVKNVA